MVEQREVYQITNPDIIVPELNFILNRLGDRLDALEGLRGDDLSPATADLTTHIADTTTHGTTGDIVGTTDTEILTNKTIDADNNTILNIAGGSNLQIQFNDSGSLGGADGFTRNSDKTLILDDAVLDGGSENGAFTVLNFRANSGNSNFIAGLEVKSKEDPAFLDDDVFIHGIVADMYTDNPAPNQNAAVLGFTYSKGGADAFGGDFHGIIKSDATATPNACIGVQGTCDQAHATRLATSGSWAVLATVEGAGTNKADSHFRANGPNGSNFILSTDANAMTDEGIVLRGADDNNGTFSVFQYFKANGTTSMIDLRKDGTAIFAGTISVPNIDDSNGNEVFSFDGSGAVDATTNFVGDIVVGSPTGGAKGNGTINAESVYDDNVLLGPDYVLEAFSTGKINYNKWNNRKKALLRKKQNVYKKRVEKKKPKKNDEDYIDRMKEYNDEKAEIITDEQITNTKHKAANRFDADLNFNIDNYVAFVKRYQKLPSMPTKEEWESENIFSVGDLTNRLLEAVEVQTIHTSQLNERIKILEAA